MIYPPSPSMGSTKMAAKDSISNPDFFINATISSACNPKETWNTPGSNGPKPFFWTGLELVRLKAP